MTQETRVCVLCAGEMTPATTTFTVDLKFGVIVVREVPALVCDQCGEAWIDDATAATLDTAVNDARSRQSLVEVTHWSQIAA